MAGACGLSLWWLPEARWFALPWPLRGVLAAAAARHAGKWLALLLWLPLLWPERDIPAPAKPSWS
jgi:competence protein ComEC